MKILKFTILYFLTISIAFSQSGWIKQYSGTTENLNAVYFINTNNGFIVGENGTLLRTVDGGSNWVKQSSGTTNNLARISFVDAQNGFIWGSNSTFLKTTDGGIIWRNVSDSLIDKIIPSRFLDLNNALSVKTSNDTIKYLKTIDGGKTWELSSIIKTYSTKIRSAVYLDLDNILIMSSQAQNCAIFHSSDSGKSWKVVLTVGGGSDGGLRNVSFIDSKIGFLLDWYGTTSQYYSDIYKTIDAGKTWKKQSYLPISKNIFMCNSNVGYVLQNARFGNQSAINKTTDGGVTWEIQRPGELSKYNSVFFTNSDTGTIVGEDGLILITTTGGIKTDDTTTTNEPLLLVYNLAQNYPNPFNPSTTIEYSIPKQSQVTIKVYDILGRELITLVNEEKVAGNYSVKFNGSNYQSGVYFYRLKSGSYSDTRKFLLLK